MDIDTFARLEPGLSVADATAKFREWLGKGLFVKADLATGSTFDAKLVHLPFVRSSIESRIPWSCDYGVFQEREYDRDYATYERDYQAYVNRGHRGYRPQSPDRDKYYDWYSSSHVSHDSGEEVFAGFDASALKGDAKLYKVALEIGDTFESRLRVPQGGGQASDPVGTLNESLADRQLYARIKERAEQIVANEVQRTYSKFTNVQLPEVDADAVSTVIYAPVYLVTYSYEGVARSAIMDGFDGRIIVGPKPRENKKIAMLAAAAAAVAAIGIGGYSLLGGGDAPLDVPVAVAAPATDAAVPMAAPGPVETPSDVSAEAAVAEAEAALVVTPPTFVPFRSGADLIGATPSATWLLGRWVRQGEDCQGLVIEYTPGRWASHANGEQTLSGEWTLAGDIYEERGGVLTPDLVDTRQVREMGENQMLMRWMDGSEEYYTRCA